MFAQIEEVAAERLNKHRFNFGSLTEADTALPQPLEPPTGCSGYCPPEQLPSTEAELRELLEALRLHQTMHLGVVARFVRAATDLTAAEPPLLRAQVRR